MRKDNFAASQDEMPVALEACGILFLETWNKKEREKEMKRTILSAVVLAALCFTTSANAQALVQAQCDKMTKECKKAEKCCKNTVDAATAATSQVAKTKSCCKQAKNAATADLKDAKSKLKVAKRQTKAELKAVPAKTQAELKAAKKQCKEAANTAAKAECSKCVDKVLK